jgi:hypothetical protein
MGNVWERVLVEGPSMLGRGCVGTTRAKLFAVAFLLEPKAGGKSASLPVMRVHVCPVGLGLVREAASCRLPRAAGGAGGARPANEGSGLDFAVLFYDPEEGSASF